jgi:hypothetical protein
MDAGPALEELVRQECLDLLSACSIGRVAVPVAGDGPLVVPVNYVLDGDVVVFRSDPGTKLTAVQLGPISFQVDQLDFLRRTGWSVLVRGLAYEATHWETDHIPLDPWAGGDKHHWVRLVPSSITGRRIRLPELLLDGRGYL